MIIYIIGYGRSGSTKISQIIGDRLGATNLGEVKYIYRNNYNDLLDPYWLEFKKQNRDILSKESQQIKKFDNIFGFLYWIHRERYKKIWTELFNRMKLNTEKHIIIDSSKTTLDSFMRGIYLNYSFQNVYFIKPKRKTIDVFKSLLKGKNVDIERENKRSFIQRFLHTVFVGMPHYILTHLLSLIYNRFNCYTITLENLESDLNMFFQQLPSDISSSGSSIKVPMIYGNRSRNKK